MGYQGRPFQGTSLIKGDVLLPGTHDVSAAVDQYAAQVQRGID